MKILKRNELSNPKKTMVIWLVPTIGYLLTKISGVVDPNKEWIWFTALPILFMTWFMLNFVITKK